MLSDESYELCRPTLEADGLEEEDKVERLEELLRKEANLAGNALENAVLDALWRHRNGSKADNSGAPLRHTVIRKSSPAPWQMNRASTPIGSPPVGSSPSLAVARPSFSRQRSSAHSPFASPRPSPRLAFAQPIPHSPSLQAYEFSDTSSTPDIYGDFGSDLNVDWLVSEDARSNASSTGTGSLSAAAPEWLPQPDMSPYDILRSVLGDRNTEAEIEEALEKNSYDLGATIAALTGGDGFEAAHSINTTQNPSVLVGKSMTVTQVRPVTPNSGKSPIVCKYWLTSGSCLRADCRFAHDTSSYLCKYWMNGQCLAGDTCKFSHDPALLVSTLHVNNSTDSLGTSPQPFQMQDSSDQFPSLAVQRPRGSSSSLSSSVNAQPFTPRGRGSLFPLGPSHRPHSRPTSRHQNRPEISSNLSMDDPEVFPTLSSLNAKRGSKHHGHRPRHGHGSQQERDATPSSLADVVKLAPNPPAAMQRKSELGKKIRSANGATSDGIVGTVAARKIPEPRHIPWLETGERANQQYLKHRQEAIKHGTIRNKFLQSAAQAWNRNDARAAKALSLRGQAENDAMRKAHREAARALYEERNEHLRSGSSDPDQEVYVDLHGLHPEEAIEYLDEILSEHSRLNRLGIGGTAGEDSHNIYAITGTGHHSKNGKDKVGKSVRHWLEEQGYIFREFSVPGERGGYIGGVLGIDVMSRRHSVREQDQGKDDGDDQDPTLTGRLTMAGSVIVGSGRIQVLKREEVGT